MLLIHLEKQPVNTKVQYVFGLCKKDDVEENKHCVLQQCFSVENKDNILTGPCCTVSPLATLVITIVYRALSREDRRRSSLPHQQLAPLLLPL